MTKVQGDRYTVVVDEQEYDIFACSSFQEHAATTSTTPLKIGDQTPVVVVNYWMYLTVCAGALLLVFAFMMLIKYNLGLRQYRRPIPMDELPVYTGVRASPPHLHAVPQAQQAVQGQVVFDTITDPSVSTIQLPDGNIYDPRYSDASYRVPANVPVLASV